MSVHLFIAGDSTAANYPKSQAPMAGWGQMIDRFFTTNVVVINKALCGRSSKSFINESVLDEIINSIEPNDYLLVQFGHNDEKPGKALYTEPFSTYQECLRKYVDGARKKGATPILITPVSRRIFDDNGNLKQTHGDYPEAVRILGRYLHVPVIDLCSSSTALLESLGPEESKRLFVWLKPGEHVNYPDGSSDNTHFNEVGAKEIAGLIVKELLNFSIPLRNYILNRAC